MAGIVAPTYICIRAHLHSMCLHMDRQDIGSRVRTNSESWCQNYFKLVILSSYALYEYE
jgi:hypothetical protein